MVDATHHDAHRRTRRTRSGRRPHHPRRGAVALPSRSLRRHFRSAVLGQPHPRTFQGQQDSPLLHRQRQGRRVLGELQLLRAIVVLPDRLAQIRFRGSRTGPGSRRGSEQKRRHRRRPRRRVERPERRPDARRSLRPHPRIEGRRQDPSRCLARHHQKPAGRRPAEGSRASNVTATTSKARAAFSRRPAPRTPTTTGSKPSAI